MQAVKLCTNKIIQFLKGKERKSIYIALFLAKMVHSKRSGMDHTVLPANNTMPAFAWAFTRCYHHSNWGSRHPIAAHYSFIDPKMMKGWVGLVGWPIADGLPTLVVIHQLQVEHRTAKARQPKTDVIPLDHATNLGITVCIFGLLVHVWFDMV